MLDKFLGLRRIVIAIILIMMMVGMTVFADQANALISFYTQGPDTYADGTRVVDGEWYALVWTKNAEFGGFTADFKPVVQGDEIVLAGKLAKDGHCPSTIFQVKSEAVKKNGSYSVYLLDTRRDGRASESVSGRPTAVNGMMAISGAVSVGNSLATTSGNEPAARWCASDVDAMVSSGRLETPRIVGICPLGEKIRITVAGMHPAVRYNISSGSTVASIKALSIAPRNGVPTGEDVTFVLPKGDGMFFKVVRQPLDM